MYAYILIIAERFKFNTHTYIYNVCVYYLKTLSNNRKAEDKYTCYIWAQFDSKYIISV